MARFHIAQVAINDHYRMYDDLIGSVAGGLADLGHTCTVGLNRYVDGAANILIGSSIFAARHHNLAASLQGRPYILYQLEQLDEAHGLLRDWPEYWTLLSNAQAIWDYNPSSLAYLHQRGLSGAVYLPPGFHPSLQTFAPEAEPEVDVLFCGTTHPRRLRILEALSLAGLRTGQISHTYGAERDAIFAKAKVIVNIHAWDDLDQLETVRLSHLLANRCCVISEISDHNPYGDGIMFAPYDALVETCRDICSRPRAERDAIAAQGFAAISQHSMADNLRRVLTPHE